MFICSKVVNDLFVTLFFTSLLNGWQPTVSNTKMLFYVIILHGIRTDTRMQPWITSPPVLFTTVYSTPVSFSLHKHINMKICLRQAYSERKQPLVCVRPYLPSRFITSVSFSTVKCEFCRYALRMPVVLDNMSDLIGKLYLQQCNDTLYGISCSSQDALMLYIGGSQEKLLIGIKYIDHSRIHFATSLSDCCLHHDPFVAIFLINRNTDTNTIEIHGN